MRLYYIYSRCYKWGRACARNLRAPIHWPCTCGYNFMSHEFLASHGVGSEVLRQPMMDSIWRYQSPVLVLNGPDGVLYREWVGLSARKVIWDFTVVVIEGFRDVFLGRCACLVSQWWWLLRVFVLKRSRGDLFWAWVRRLVMKMIWPLQFSCSRAPGARFSWEMPGGWGLGSSGEKIWDAQKHNDYIVAANSASFLFCIHSSFCILASSTILYYPLFLIMITGVRLLWEELCIHEAEI